MLLSTEKKDEVAGEVDHEEINYSAWGEWGKWQTSEIGATEGLDVEEGTQYRYREKEYTTSQKASLSGWTQYDLKTEQVWGNWSGWSDNTVAASDTRQVETGTQYRYRDKEYTTSSSSSLDGWTQYDVSTSSDWGPWSDWSTTEYFKSQTRDVMYREESRYRDKVFPPSTIPDYWYWGNWSSWDWAYYDESDTRQVERRTLYCYRDLTTSYTYYYFRWKSWSPWANDAVSQSNNRDVQTRTVFRYRDLNTSYTYYYWRWGDWSEWSFTEAKASDEMEVANRSVYRSREGEKVPIYYYYDWSDWSDWSTDKETEADDREVESRTVFRYRDRQ